MSNYEYNNVPQNEEGDSALDATKFKKPIETSEFELDYRSGLEVGSSVEFRIMRLNKSETNSYPTVPVKLYSPKKGTPLNLRMYLPDRELAQDLYDHDGVRVSDIESDKIRYMLRVPIFVYKINKMTEGKIVTEEVNKLYFVELGGGLKKTLKELKEAGGLTKFDETTGRPNYDMLLKIVPGQSAQYNKNYDVEAITLAIDKQGKPVTHPNFGLTAEEAIKEWEDTEVRPNWGKMMEGMFALPTETELRNFLAKKTNNGNTPQSTAKEESEAGLNADVFGD